MVSGMDHELMTVEDSSGWSETRKTRYINYVTVTLTHIIIFYILGSRGYVIVRDTLADQ